MTKPYSREIDLDMHNEMAEDISRLQNEVDLLRGRLTQIIEICDDNARATFPDMALRFVRQVAATPLTRQAVTESAGQK